MSCDAVREPEAAEVHARETPGDRESLGGGSEGERDVVGTILDSITRAAAAEAAKQVLIHRIVELERRVSILEAIPRGPSTIPSPYRTPWPSNNVWQSS